jgi:hypothetical protein
LNNLNQFREIEVNELRQVDGGWAIPIIVGIALGTAYIIDDNDWGDDIVNTVTDTVKNTNWNNYML